MVSGSLSSTDFYLYDIEGYIWFISGGIGNLYDQMWRINGEGSDVFFKNWYSGIRFYDADGNLLEGGRGAIDGAYSQLAPIIRFVHENEGYSTEGYSSPTRIYQGGQLTLTQVPIPAAIWFFGSAFGLMGVMPRKI
jgi:hypothetical protein